MKKLNELFKSKKQIILIAVLMLSGFALMIFPLGEGTAERESTSDYAEVTSYTEKLEKRIREMCLSVDGVKEACVLVTLESGSEYVYADNITEQKSADTSHSYTSDYLIVEGNDGTSPVVVKEIYPKIRGVAVVCNGGDSPVLQKKLTELLSAALGISSGRIKISS